MPRPIGRTRDVRRILIVSLDNLGDTVFASALVPPLRARFPDAALGVWSKAYAADVARLIPTVSEVYAADPFWDRAPGRGKGGFGDFVRSVRAVRRARFDVAILAAAPWRVAAATRLAGIPIRIGLERRRNARWLTHPLAAEDKHRPVLEEMARLLAPLHVRHQPLRYALDPAPLADRRAALAATLDWPYVALHPFASKRDRCVPVAGWLEVARAVERRGLDVAWIGSAAELDEVRAAAEGERMTVSSYRSRDRGDSDADSMRAGPPGAAHDAASAPPHWHYVDRLGDGSLATTAAVLAGATLFAGHDSGPLHVAAAFGVPVVGVFAPGEPDRTFPQGIGPWRMIARPSPAAVEPSAIVDALDELSRGRPERSL